MKRERRSFALLFALAVGVAGSAEAQNQRRGIETVRLPAGTVLQVRLDERLSSAQARPGDRFTATTQPDEDRSGLPPGTRVVGVVREARVASKEQPGILDVEFTAIELPGGRSYPISGVLTSLDSNSVSRAEDGRLVAKRRGTNDRMRFIGYGAGAGALIALLTRGDLLTNILLGAGGGFLYDQLRRDRQRGQYADVDLKPGAEFGVRLDQQFTYLPVSDRRVDGARRSDEALGGLYREREPRARRDRVSGPERTVPGLEVGGRIDVAIEDRPVVFGAARPMLSANAVMIPVAPVLRAANLRYFYNPLTREISVTSDSGVARATVGSDVATVGGDRVRLEEPPRTIDGVLYVPERFIELAAGLEASWDDAGQTLRFRRGSAPRDRDRQDRGL